MREDDPLHQHCGPHTLWSRVNLAEALPGVLTPLGWDFWDHAMEWSSRQIFFQMGVLPRAELAEPERVDARFAGIFYGRAAANVDKFSSVVDRIPGTSGAAFEEQLLGSPDPRARRTRTLERWRRYPVVTGKLPVAALRLPGRVRAMRVETDAWWRRMVAEAPGDDLAAARRRFAGALEQFRRVMRVHGFATMLGQAVYDQLTKLVPPDAPDLPLRLAAGYGDVAESEVVGDLWRAARGEHDLARFLADHGFHGPDEGELASCSWREDLAPLEPVIEQYRSMDESDSPVAAGRRAAQERERAEAELLESLDSWKRGLGRVALAAGRRYVPLREEGKSAYLQAIDAGRMAARRVGSLLADAGDLDRAEDVFFLTVDEMREVPFEGLRPLVQRRRERRDEHKRVTVPDVFRGMPEPSPVEAASAGTAPAPTEELVGLGASPGVHEGRVRIVLDPAACPAFEPGDVLVCPTTDPGWAPLFMVAGALVTDIGGVLSHGAVIARELGIPSVVNTGRGTEVLRDGELVVVDGGHGSVRRRDGAAP